MQGPRRLRRFGGTVTGPPQQCSCLLQHFPARQKNVLPPQGSGGSATPSFWGEGLNPGSGQIMRCRRRGVSVWKMRLHLPSGGATDGPGNAGKRGSGEAPTARCGHRSPGCCRRGLGDNTSKPGRQPKRAGTRFPGCVLVHLEPPTVRNLPSYRSQRIHANLHQI